MDPATHARLSPAQRLGKTLLRNYKQYVAPYQDVHCNCTPTCSQYTREAIETHGLVEGAELGFFRLLACSATKGHLDDPVPGAPPHPVTHDAPTTLVPPPDHRSRALRAAEGIAFAGARIAGQAAGGMLGAVALVPFGVGFCGALGFMVGRGSIDRFNQRLCERHPLSAVRKMAAIEDRAGDLGFTAYRGVKALTGCERAGHAVGCAVGAVTGGAVGALGAAAFGWRFGSRFGGLWAQNRLKDACGQLPRDPATDAILRRDYGI